MAAEAVLSILAATLVATSWALRRLAVGTSAQQLSWVLAIPLCPACERHHSAR